MGPSIGRSLRRVLLAYIRTNVEQLAEEVVDFEDATEVGGCDTCSHIVARVHVTYTVHPDLGERRPRSYYHEQDLAAFIKELDDLEQSGVLDH